MQPKIRRLKYSISSWEQAKQCLSNNDRELHICLANYIHNPEFEGEVISVEHDRYGILFAAAIEGRGSCVSLNDRHGATINFLTTTQILEQLEKFGFDIVYEEEPNLPGGQLDYLMNLLDLGYDAITRVLVVESKNSVRNYVVAYNSTRSVDYLKFATKVLRSFFNKSLEAGWAINVSTARSDLHWDWLTYTCQIDDILKHNSKFNPVREPAPSSIPETPHDIPEMTVLEKVDTGNFHVYGSVEVEDDLVGDNDGTA